MIFERERALHGVVLERAPGDRQGYALSGGEGYDVLRGGGDSGIFNCGYGHGCTVLEAIDAARSVALAFFEHYDVILCPPSHALPRPHGASHGDSFDDWSYMTIHNLLGWPGLSLRAGSSAEGLPVGVQIVTPPWREDIALALAARLQTLMGGFQPPPR